MVGVTGKRLVALVAVLLCMAHPSDLSSCGPFLPQAVFIRPVTPDHPESFYRGRLGILQPSYERRFLAMAYRTLAGMPLSEAGVESAMKLDEYRSSGNGEAEMDQWQAARATVPGTQKVSINSFKSGSSYSSYRNCNTDAFRTAAATLGDYTQKNDKGSDTVRRWLAAQDQVFQNCDAGPVVPPPAEQGDTPEFKADRAYQIGAARFYAGQYGEAKQTFLRIATDKQSRWHEIASYLAARCDLRQDNFPEAERELHQIAADNPQNQTGGAARALLGHVEARLNPAARMVVLSQSLLARNPKNLGRDLSDYTLLYDAFESPNSPEKHLPLEDQLTGWIYVFQGSDPKAATRAEEMYQAHQELPFLISALQYATGKTPDVNNLVSAAAKIGPSSSAFETARFHAVRLLLEQGRREEAVKLVSEALEATSGHAEDLSSQNAFRAERMKAAAGFEEFTAYAPRTMAGKTIYSEMYSKLDPPSKTEAEPLSYFDTDAASIFNSAIPLSLWLRAAKDTHVAPRLRAELARSGWVRVVLTGGTAAAEFRRELVRMVPAYSGDFPAGDQSRLEEQAFAAVFWMLHHPEAQPLIRSGLPRETQAGKIDEYRDNWWCQIGNKQKFVTVKADSKQQRMPGQGGYPEVAQDFSFQVAGAQQAMTGLLKQLYPSGEASADFLTMQQKQEATEQMRKIESTGSAVTYLSGAVLRWVKAHPDDPRNAEALALAVKTSRYGCADQNSNRYAKEAFRMLHARYPDTPWAKRTPYWYN